MDLRAVIQQVPSFQSALAAQGKAIAAFGELETHLAALAQAAFFDERTGLMNKSAFNAAIKLYAQPGLRLAVVFVDLAGFKELNDANGHEAGDIALKNVGDDLATVAKGNDAFAYRVGGDEFVVTVRPEGLDQVLRQMTRLLNRIEFEAPNGKQVKVTATIGYADPEDGVLLKELLERADAACRLAKQNGDGAPVAWTPAVATEAPQSYRKRCRDVTCRATTTVQVTPSRRRSGAPVVCANCGESMADEPAPAV